MKVLVTGAAGFIGAALCARLLERGDEVIGVDNFSAYYDVRLKEERVAALASRDGFSLHRMNLADREATAFLLRSARPDRIAHLAAQPGIRHAFEHPEAYVEANLSAFMNVLDAARRNETGHFLYASSSAVYGGNTKLPFSELDAVDHPLSLYGATKRANELFAHSYSHLYGLPTTGLRYFTVYGPRGRPDMTPMLFADAILSERPLLLFKDGRHRRDFTYIDDAVRATLLALDRVPAAGAGTGSPAAGPGPSRVYNVGNGHPVEMTEFVEVLERQFDRKAQRTLAPAQPGEMDATWCDSSEFHREFGFAPTTRLDDGAREFAQWYAAWWKGRA